MEILVAVALLGLLSAGIVTAIQVAADSWQSARSRLTLDRRVASANEMFHSLFAGIARVEAETPPRGDTGPQRFLFFQGEPQSMRFVSSYAAGAGRRAGLQISELQIVEARRGRRVLLNQRPYRSPRSAGILVEGFTSRPGAPGRHPLFRAIQAQPGSLILADELEAVRFAYLARPIRTGEPAAWVPNWADARNLPAAITVYLTPGAEQARLLPVSITTPVRADGWYRRAAR